MTELTVLKTGLKVSTEVIKKINQIIKNIKKNNYIISEIREYLIENYEDIDLESIDHIIGLKLKKVTEEYEHINTKQFIPNIKDIVISTMDLVFENYEILCDEEVSNEIENVAEEIIEKLFEDNRDIYETYKSLVIQENIMINIPKSIMELKVNQSFNNYVSTNLENLTSINQRLKKNRKQLTLDFWDYDDINFENKLINSISDENYIMVSGPSVEEAQWYVSYILDKNNIGNVHYVKSKSNWESIQPVECCDFYNKVIFVQLFSENVDTIPNSTTIVFTENDSILENNDTLSFQKRSKNISVEKLKQILPMKNELNSNENRYSYNDVYSIVESAFNEYDIYMKEVLIEKSQHKIIGLDEVDLIVGLVGSFSNSNESKDFEIMKKYFEVIPEHVNQITTTYKMFEDERTLFVLENRKVINEMISRRQLTNDILDKYIAFATEVCTIYLRQDNIYFFDEKLHISKGMWNSISNVTRFIKLHSPDANIIQRIYREVIRGLNGVERAKIQIALFNHILLYDVRLLNKEIFKFISSEEVIIVNEEIKTFIRSEYYSDKLLAVLSKMLYSKLYGSNSSNYIIDILSVLLNDNQINKYKDSIKRYYSYVANDYPLEADKKIEKLVGNPKYLNEVIEIIVNNEYEMSSWWQREIKNELGYMQIDRNDKITDQARLDYNFKIQELYLSNVEKVDISLFIDDLNLYFFNTDKIKIKKYIEDNELSDLQVCKAILKLRDMISLKKAMKNQQQNKKIISNGQALLDLLESKLSNINYKYMYIFDINIFSIKRLNEEQTRFSDIDEDSVNNIKSAILKLDMNTLKEMVKIYLKVQDKWINDFEFLLQVMQSAEFSFDEGLDLFTDNNERQIVSYISSHELFNTSKQDAVKLIMKKTSSNNLKSNHSYYFQHLNYTAEEIQNEPVDIQYSLLKYKNIYRIKEEEVVKFYFLFKSNNLFNNCIEILLDNSRKFEIEHQLNIIKEFKDMVFHNNVEKLDLSFNEIQNGYEVCLNYYKENETEENQLLMQHISVGLSNSIEDFSFLSNEFLTNEYFFMQMLAAAYPKAFELEDLDSLADNHSNYYLLFRKLDMNCVPLDSFSMWCNTVLTNIKDKEIHKCLLRVIGDLCGKYFEKNDKILEKINEEFVLETMFQRAFIIAYSNTMGVVSSGLNEIPGKYLSRKEKLNKLVKELNEMSLFAHIELINLLIDDLNRTIQYSEDRRRN